MERKEAVFSIQNLLFMNLLQKSPVLSGNMQSLIQCGLTTPSQAEIVIEAPFYDMKKWKKEGVVVHTGENKKGYTDYAEWVNMLGGFATHNKSEHWVNKAIYEVVTEIANELGATVINRLEL